MGLWPTTVTENCTQELLADVRPKVLQDIGKLVPADRPPRHGLPPAYMARRVSASLGDEVPCMLLW